MKKYYLIVLLFLLVSFDLYAQITVDCTTGPVNNNFCYDDNAIEEFTYVSSDGSVLNLVVNSGNVENIFDQFIVLDSDGTELYNGYGNQGDLSGLSFQSSGDNITVQVVSDFIISCQDNANINPIDLQVSCATCVNPEINFELVDDCLNAPQFFVEADVVDLGSAQDLTITDNQGNPAQIATATGVYSFGPYPNGTLVELTAQNNQDVNCQIVSDEFTQDVCTTNLVDCSAGPVNTSFCYDNSNLEYTYVSNDGSVLNLVINSGNVQEHFDAFIVLDSDGTELYNGFGNQGDLSGLNFQSSGDSISVQVISNFGSNCQNNANINPIDLQVSCATCINPDINFELVDDCLNAPQFFVEADLTDLGSAQDLTITDNQGNPAQIATATGVYNFGPYPNGTIVELTAENNQDSNCQIVSDEFTQNACTTNLVDCSLGPINTTFCYDDNAIEEFTYVSSDGSVLNLVVNSGNVENIFDQFIVLDSDGTELYNGYGNQGDLSGLNFQSSGDNITVQVVSDFIISCQDNANINPIDLQVSCATCVNPEINFELVDDCLNAPQFFVEADVVDLGSAQDLTITDNQGNPAQIATATGVYSFGPYPNGTLVELTAQNNQDVNCQIFSDEFTQDVCTTNLVDCSAGPVNTSFCYDNSNLEYTYVSNDGSVLNLVINSGNVQEHFDAFIVLDSDGTELYNGFGNQGDLSGLNFQSSGDSISVQVISNFGSNCQNNANINPIDLQVSCATCINPDINFELVDDCLNAPQFFVEADVTDLGSAQDVIITDNQGSPPQTATATGVYSFGPYPNGTLVELTAENNQDSNCQIVSDEFTQNACTTNLVDCSFGPINTTFCYDDNAIEEFTYVSSDGSVLNLVVNSGNVENIWDEFIVLDSDGTALYIGYGNQGDLSGLQFQSSGDTITVQVDADFSINCQDNSNINPIDLTVSCSLLNTVSGNVLYDIDNDGCDPDDFVLSNYMVHFNDGTQDMSVSIDENGQYSAELSAGTFTLSVLNLHSNFASTPVTQTISFTGQDETIDNVDFCITAVQQFDDLAIDIIALEDVIPGFETDYQVIVTNNGTQTVPIAQVTFVYDDNLQSFVTSTIPPTGNTPNLLTYELIDVDPFSSQTFIVTMLNANQPTLNEGEVVTVTVQVTPDANDADTKDNTASSDQTATNSADPNNMMVMQGSEIAQEDTDQFLDYRIRFQNMGMANTQHVRITDTIHGNLDWSTFHPTSSSHDYRIEIMDGEQINIFFDDIDLPNENTDEEGSVAYISYKIRPHSDLQVGDFIENTAHIHFGSNLPIETNTAVTTVVGNLSVDSFNLSQIKLYPNPVENVLNVNWSVELNINSITLFDLNGRRIKSYDVQSTLDMTQIQSGIYILKVESDEGSFYKKVIKR